MSFHLFKSESFIDVSSVINEFHSSKNDAFPISKPLFDIYNCLTQEDEFNIYNKLKQQKEEFEQNMCKSLSCLEEMIQKELRSTVLTSYYSIVKCTHSELDLFDFKSYLINKVYDGSGENNRADQHFCSNDLNRLDNQGNLSRYLRDVGYNNFRTIKSHFSFDDLLTKTRESCVIRCQNSAANRDFNPQSPYITLRPNCFQVNDISTMVNGLISFGVASIYENYLVFKAKIPGKFDKFNFCI